MKGEAARLFGSPPAPVRGAAWMILSGLMFGVLVFQPYFRRAGLTAFRTHNTPLYIACGVTSMAVMYLWFGARLGRGDDPIIPPRENWSGNRPSIESPSQTAIPFI